jgi:hypothetical protein
LSFLQCMFLAPLSRTRWLQMLGFYFWIHYSNPLIIIIYSNTVLVLLLCIIFWNQVFWYLYQNSFCSWMLWWFEIFCAYCTGTLVFLTLWEFHWNFDRDCFEFVDPFQWHAHFHHTNSSNPGTLENFLYLSIFCLICKCFVVFTVEVFHFFG